MLAVSQNGPRRNAGSVEGYRSIRGGSKGAKGKTRDHVEQGRGQRVLGASASYRLMGQAIAQAIFRRHAHVCPTFQNKCRRAAPVVPIEARPEGTHVPNRCLAALEPAERFAILPSVGGR